MHRAHAYSAEIQRYLFKVGPIDLIAGTLLSGIVDFFEEGVAAGKGVLELIGNGPSPVGILTVIARF